MSLRSLLEVQRTDLAITQAERRSSELPQRPAHAAAVAAQRALDAEAARLGTRLTELQAQLSSAESRGAGLDGEIARLEAKLTGAGSVREADALQHEIDARRAERSAADDLGLEAMDGIERTTADIARVAGESEVSSRAVAAATAELSAAVAAIETELAELRSARAERAAAVPAELLARYEARRVERPSRVVAELTGAACGGCHEELSPSELDELRRGGPDDLVSCPNCSCWLVR